MAAPTDLLNFATANQSYEVVQLEVTDGDIYESKKFDIVRIAIASANEDQNAHINCTISGSAVTINYAGMTDKDVTLFLCGTTGP